MRKLISVLCVGLTCFNTFAQEIAAPAAIVAPEITPLEMSMAMQEQINPKLVLSENDIDAIAIKIAESQKASKDDESNSWVSKHPVLTWMGGIAVTVLAIYAVAEGNKGGDNTYYIDGSYVSASGDGDGNDSVSVDTNDGDVNQSTGTGNNDR